MNSRPSHSSHVESELHLRSGVILSIFIGITVLLAALFGLAYSIANRGGKRQPLPAAVASASSSQTMPAISAPAPSIQTTDIARPVLPVAAKAALSKQPVATHTAYMVQVAAVVRRKDAMALSVALRKHGLHAQLRTTSHDKFFHVQIGPFTTQQQAETMRHKVMTAGYKAILKPA